MFLSLFMLLVVLMNIHFKKMPPGFKGICAISYFNNASLEEIKQLRKEWSTHA